MMIMKGILGQLAEVAAGNTILNYIANTCVTVTVVILFLLLVRPLMKKLPRMGMYVLWFAVVLRILCPFSFRGIYSLVPEQMEQQAARTNSKIRLEQFEKHLWEKKDIGGGLVNHYRLAKLPAADTQSDSEVIRAQSDKTDETCQKSGQVVKTANLQAEGNQEQATQGEEIGTWLLCVWGAGLLFCIGYVTGSLLRIRSRFRDARCEGENIYSHPDVVSSFVSGFLSPKIYLSPYLKQNERDYILAHERVHIRRRDYILKPLVFCIFAVLWFNPFIWLAWYLMMQDMEISCDESAVREFGSTERKQYSYLLLRMAGGPNLPGQVQVPAFCAGEVKERIKGVLGYKRPTAFITVIAIAAVSLCGCAVFSTPEETVKTPSPKEKKETVFVEQELETGEWDDWGDYLAVPNVKYVMNPDGQFVCFRTLYSDSEKTKERDLTYAKINITTGKQEEISWLAAYRKRFPGRNFELERYRYGADGNLYLYVVEYSMDKRTYRDDVRKYAAEFEARHYYLMKVDEKSGEMTEIPVSEEILAGGDFDVTADGNLLAAVQGEQKGTIYQGVTGEKMQDVTFVNRESEIYAGDDFWVYASRNSKSQKLEVNVLDEDGDLKQTIVSSVKRERSQHTPFALGVRENSIMLACDEGIFEAELGDKEFHCVASVQTDNIYFLGLDTMQPNCIYKEEDEYFIGMLKCLPDSEWAPGYGPDAWDTDKIYCYARLEP